MKLLALCDSPTLTSGFSRVAQNLFKCWHKRGVQIDCFGIAFAGWDYKKIDYINTIYPGGGPGEWCSGERLQIFLTQLSIGGYTHVWIMQDTFLLSTLDFPAALRQVCSEKNIRSMLYFPVDAALDPEWTDIIAAVDVPVAYTHYGAGEAHEKAKVRAQNLNQAKVSTTLNYEFECQVLPHGVDTDIYVPLPGREKLRHELYSKSPWLQDDDFFILNVNANQCRKDVPRSMELLSILRGRGVPAKLCLHMPETGGPEQGISLEQCARQLGLEKGVWGHHGMMFKGGQSILPESTDYKVKGNGSLVGFYNAADLYLTTTLGEGWGLGITEALACGTPVAMPNHTSCKEIAGGFNAEGYEDMICLLGLEPGTIVHRADNTRMRHRVHLIGAANEIEKYYRSNAWRKRSPVRENKNLKEWLSWDRIAAEMLRLFKKSAIVKAPAPRNVTPSPGGEFIEFGDLEVCSK